MCFNYLLQLVLVVCCVGLLLVSLFPGTLAIFLGLEIGSLLGFALILVRMLT